MSHGRAFDRTVRPPLLYGELKGHRDELVRLVGEGKLTGEEIDDDAVIQRAVARPSTGLSPEAVQILLAAVSGKHTRVGMIYISRSMSARFEISAGDKSDFFAPNDARAIAKYKAALAELEEGELVEHRSESLREVTHKGYLVADELLAAGGDSLGA